MGRPRSRDEDGRLKKGPWTPEEDRKLRDYIEKHGHHGSWRRLPNLAGLSRCGKSCRLRWTNYLRPDIKRGDFTDAEEKLIIQLHASLGNKWSAIATRLPGRTDNEIKNYWNTHVRKKLLQMGIDPVTYQKRSDDIDLLAAAWPSLLAAGAGTSLLTGSSFSLERLIELQLLQALVQLLTCGSELFGSAAAGKQQLDDMISTSVHAVNPNSLHTPNRLLGLQQALQPAPAAHDSSSECMVTVNESGCATNSSANSMLSGSLESMTKNHTVANTDHIWDDVNLDLENELDWKEFIDRITTSSWLA